MPCEHEDGFLQTRKGGLRRNEICWHFDLLFLASWTVRNKLSVVSATQSLALYYRSPRKLIWWICSILLEFCSYLYPVTFHIFSGFCFIHSYWKILSSFLHFPRLPCMLLAEHLTVVIFARSQSVLMIFLFKLPGRFIEKLVREEDNSN